MQIALVGADPSALDALAQALAARADLVPAGTHIRVGSSLPDGAHASPETCFFLLALPPGADAIQEAQDDQLRAALVRADCGFQILACDTATALQQIRDAINSVAVSAQPALVSGQKHARNQTWSWPCDKCSDPQCERRLFTERLNLRAAACPLP